MNKITGKGKGHAKAYEMQMKHKTWNSATPLWRLNIIKAYNKVKKGEL